MCILSDINQKHFVQGQRRPINHHYIKYQAVSTEAIRQSYDISQNVKAPLIRPPETGKFVRQRNVFQGDTRCSSTKCSSTAHGQNQMAWFEINQGFTAMKLIFLSGDSANAVPH